MIGVRAILHLEYRKCVLRLNCGQPCNLIDLPMLESSAADYHASGPGEVDQLQSVIKRFVVDTKFTGGGKTDTLLARTWNLNPQARFQYLFVSLCRETTTYRRER